MVTPTGLGTPHAAATQGTAAICLAAFGTFFLSTYWLANRITSARADVGATVFEWERAIPFVECTIVPYLSIAVFFVASFFVRDSRAGLDAHVKRLVAALLISLLCFAVFPQRFAFERPLTSGVTGLLFDALAAFDQPYNRAPSLHISVLVILWARFAPRCAGWQRLALQAWFALIGVSVLTTYQHHFIDVPAGFVVGWTCVRMFPATRPAWWRALRVEQVFGQAPRGLRRES